MVIERESWEWMWCSGSRKAAATLGFSFAGTRIKHKAERMRFSAYRIWAKQAVGEELAPSDQSGERKRRGMITSCS